jgi:hypothetical protein
MGLRVEKKIGIAQGRHPDNAKAVTELEKKIVTRH